MRQHGARDGALAEFLLAIELHDPRRLARVCDAGLDLRAPLEGRPALDWLLGMYTRSERFSACARVLLERGAALPDPALGPVLLDDAEGIRAVASAPGGSLRGRVDLPCAFTPLDGATLLHVAAEFQCAGALRALLAGGAEVDARAGMDAHGLGGQTALFHTVNSNANRARPLMEALLDAGARADARVAGLVWGRGQDWQSAFFDLTPIAYAQLGCLPQMHREERDVADNVRRLLAAAGRSAAAVANVPNRYLRG